MLKLVMDMALLGHRTASYCSVFINNTASQRSGGAMYSNMDSMNVNVQVVIDQNYYNNNTANSFV